MKRNNFGQIGIIIAVSTTVLHYFEIIDIYVNGIISAIALVFLLISLYDRFTGRKWIRNMKKWFLGKRVFTRWRLIVLMLIGVWVGSMLEYNPSFAIPWGLLMAWDLTKKP